MTLHGTDISACQAATVPSGDFVIIKAPVLTRPRAYAVGPCGRRREAPRSRHGQQQPQPQLDQ
jgi:hypothetical protein